MKRFSRYLGFALMICVGALSYTTEAKAAGKTIEIKPTEQNVDITEELDAALKEARDTATATEPVIVKVAAGTYKTSDVLHIYSNTTLDLTGVTLQYSSDETHTVLMSGTNGKYKGYADYNNSVACAGYNGFENITIKGGTFIGKKTNESTIIRLFHAKNVTLEGVTVSGGGCAHQVEVAAIDGFYVRNCTFKDFGNSTSGKKQEALQLDVSCSSNAFRGIYLDGTVMKNVEITNCTFSNVPRGVGSHSLLLGAYFENVKINNNTFEDIWEEAIIGLNYKNCEIKNNTITDCGAGILFQAFKSAPDSIYTTVFDGITDYHGEIIHDANTVISGNVISTKYSRHCDEIQGIKVYGLKMDLPQKGGEEKTVPAGHYYISGVIVENNKITTAGWGIHMMDVKDCVVRKNTVIGNASQKSQHDGIFIEKNVTNTSVTGNTIENIKGSGIFVQRNVYLTALSDNKISNCGKAGISFYLNSGMKDITGNTIKNCKTNGIIVGDGCAITNIVDNTISLTKAAAGITVYKNSTVGKIRKNTIKNTSSSGIITTGIKLTSGVTVGEISNNKIISSKNKNVANTGILLSDKCKVKGAVKNNQIGKVTASAIKVAKSQINGSISGNTITSAKSGGILIYNKSKVNKDIKKNVIKKAKNGIAITNGSKVKGIITKNKIKKVSGKKIRVDRSSKVRRIK